MKIDDLNISSVIRDFYKKSGLDELYPPQAEVIEKGLFGDANFLIEIPTASGKTFIAELAMLREVQRGGKALYIVPLRALAAEKYNRFKEFESFGVNTGISTGDYDKKNEDLGNNDIIVATSEKVDSLLRNNTKWISEVNTVIIDEIHLLNSENRGTTLEIVITKLRKLNPCIQIVGLSATIGNSTELAEWLDAKLITSEWRPTELKEGVFNGKNIEFREDHRIGLKPIENVINDHTSNLVLDTLKDGAQCLVFDSSRRNCTGVAKRLTKVVKPTLTVDDEEHLSILADDILSAGEVETTNILADCVRGGAAFHHAGLNSKHRKIVEDGFRNNLIKVVSSTPTLAAGLNLPARRVIIKSYQRYDPNFGMKNIPVLEYKQMAGRAGRPHLDPYGEAVTITGHKQASDDFFKEYINGKSEDVQSNLGSESALRTHILSSIVSGFVESRRELIEFLGSTFYAFQNDVETLNETLDECLTFLIDNGMVVSVTGESVQTTFDSKDVETHSDMLVPTALGKMVSVMYIDPLSGAMIVDGLKRLENITDMPMLHLICSTPDMRSLYMRSSDYSWVDQFVSEHHSEFVNVPSPFKAVEYDIFLGEVKTAVLLHHWVTEVSLSDIADRFGVGEGDIHGYANTAEWLIHASVRLAELLDIDDIKPIAALEYRLHYGTGIDLVDLVNINGIGRARARKLYDAGIKNCDTLRSADAGVVAALVGPKIAESIYLQVGMTGRHQTEIAAVGDQL